MAEEGSVAQQSTRLLRRLFRGLDNRKSLPGGAARTRLDAHLVGLLEEMGALYSEDQLDELDAPPPRPIALAVALAVYSQPHVSSTFSRLRSQGTEEVSTASPAKDPPLVIPPEVLEEALGLPSWELDDIREDVDLRTGRVLKRARGLHWMWSRFGLPDGEAESLFRVLFPGIPSGIETVGLYRRGAQLYAVMDQEVPPPPEALYLSWLDLDDELTYAPLGSFKGRYVDEGLRHQLGRAVGADDEEVVEILDRMVTILPREGLAQLLELDDWRSSSRGPICALADDYATPTELVRGLRPDEIDYTDWMAVRDGKLAVRNLRRTLDGMLLPRVDTMVRHLQALILAQSLATPGRGPCPEDLLLYDTRSHITRVAAPLLEWTSAQGTIEFMARDLDVTPEEVLLTLTKVRTTWDKHLESVWLGPPRQGEPLSVQALLVRHMIAHQTSLRRLLERLPAEDTPHRELLALTAGHYLAVAPLQRLWAGPRADGSPSTGQLMGPDPLGRWFWRTWMRLLSYFEAEPETMSEEMETFAL